MFNPSNILVGVLSSKYTKGVSTLLDPPQEACSVVTFQEMIHTQWPTDAHFVNYAVSINGDSGEPFPRLRKTMIPYIRTHHSGALAVMSQALVFDYDNPGHEPWESRTDSLPQFFDRLQGLADRFPLLWQWSCLYTTRAGARLIYLLDEPMWSDDLEPKHAYLVERLHEAGLPVDRACTDWTRLFRCPKVLRDGIKTAGEPYFTVLEQWNNHLAVQSIGSASLARTQIMLSRTPKILDIPKPTPEECETLLHLTNPATGRRRKTSWHIAAKRLSANLVYFNPVWEKTPLADAGNRNERMVQMVGSAIRTLFYSPGTTPQHVYAIFREAAEALEPDHDTPDWTDVLWDQVLRIWAAEEAKDADKEYRDLSEAMQGEETLEDIVDGVRSWDNSADLHASDATVRNYVLRRLIVSIGSVYYLMGRNGRYSSHGLGRGQVIPAIRNGPLGEVIKTREINANGRAMDIDVTRILNDHSIAAEGVVGVPQIEGGYLDTTNPESPQLVVCLYRRNPFLAPRFDPEVDEWLRAFFGEHYDEACEWIGHALAFEDGPICALSLECDPGVGKKLLVQGLAECLERPSLGGGYDLISQFQPGLVSSPFVVVNEGWPRAMNGRHPADEFRILTGGDAKTIDRKYLSPMSVRNPARIIMTSNNADMVRNLTAGKELTVADREAIALRILHFVLGDEGAVFLREKGGIAFTGRGGRRWIASDSGLKSDFIVARHFLWLWKTRQPSRFSRLLVEGGSNTELLFEMQTASGASPLVIESIIRLIETQSDGKGVVLRDADIDGEPPKIFVTTAAILDYFRAFMANKAGERLSSHQINKVLANIARTGDSGKKAALLPERAAAGRVRWHDLDISVLSRAAATEGMTTPHIERMRVQYDAWYQGYIASGAASIGRPLR